MAQFQFVMRSGPTPGVVFPLEGGQLTIGRDSSNHVAINDAEVSRKHARLTFQGGKFVLEDLGSTNGTFVNGQRLARPVVLKPGDVVSLGEQIMLMYEAINVDPGATMAAPRRAAHMAPSMPAQAAIPIAAPPYSPAPEAPAKKSNNMMIIIIGMVMLACVCMCIVTLLIVDADPTGARWCIFPFRIIAEILRGPVCP